MRLCLRCEFEIHHIFLKTLPFSVSHLMGSCLRYHWLMATCSGSAERLDWLADWVAHHFFILCQVSTEERYGEDTLICWLTNSNSEGLSLCLSLFGDESLPKGWLWCIWEELRTKFGHRMQITFIFSNPLILWLLWMPGWNFAITWEIKDQGMRFRSLSQGAK